MACLSPLDVSRIDRQGQILPKTLSESSSKNNWVYLQESRSMGQLRVDDVPVSRAFCYLIIALSSGMGHRSFSYIVSSVYAKPFRGAAVVGCVSTILVCNLVWSFCEHGYLRTIGSLLIMCSTLLPCDLTTIKIRNTFQNINNSFELEFGGLDMLSATERNLTLLLENRWPKMGDRNVICHDSALNDIKVRSQCVYKDGKDGHWKTNNDKSRFGLTVSTWTIFIDTVEPPEGRGFLMCCLNCMDLMPEQVDQIVNARDELTRRYVNNMTARTLYLVIRPIIAVMALWPAIVAFGIYMTEKDEDPRHRPMDSFRTWEFYTYALPLVLVELYIRLGCLLVIPFGNTKPKGGMGSEYMDGE